MPTSNEEAKQIVDIINDYVTQEDAEELTARLEQEIGRGTDNESLRISLEMLKALYAPPPPKPKLYTRRAILSCVVALHLSVVVVNCISFFVLPFLYSPWIWVPLNSFILTVTFAPPGACPLTRLENKLRQRLDLPRIGGFLGHYIVKPIKMRLNNSGN